jgi:hypothetical protein
MSTRLKWYERNARLSCSPPSAAETDRRARLRAQIAEEMRKPLAYVHERPTPSERKEIALTMRAYKRTLSWR